MTLFWMAKVCFSAEGEREKKFLLKPQILQDFSSLQCPGQLWGPPSLQPNGKRGSFPGVKATRTEADTHIHLLPTSRNDRLLHKIQTVLYVLRIKALSEYVYLPYGLLTEIAPSVSLRDISFNPEGYQAISNYFK